MIPLYKTGADLKARREMCGLTQKELAEASGIDAARLSRIEHGKADRMIKGFERIMNAYGFEIRAQQPYRLNIEPYKTLEAIRLTPELRELQKAVDDVIRSMNG